LAVSGEIFFLSSAIKPFFFLTVVQHDQAKVGPGNTKGASITVPLTSSLTGLEPAV
jgi:hypothetical protein